MNKMEEIEEKLEINNILENKKVLEYSDGLKKGLPIALGYISVSLTFGMIATRGGMNPITAVLISMTNLTSAGQFAGVELMFSMASFFEIALATFVINIRYMLMSFSLIQKLKKKDFTIIKRCIVAFGITDETFAVASLEDRELTFKYMCGLITLPYIGWGFGTFIGAVSTKFMGENLQDALGIALYGMFIALIVPAVKKNKAIFISVCIAIFISILFRYIHLLSKVSTGFVVIIASITASCVCAKLFPIEEEE